MNAILGGIYSQQGEIMDSKVIVITGASGGIGAALAKHLGKQGHSLALGARRQQELEQVARESGSKAVAVFTDVTRRSNVEHLRDEALDKFGHIDVWVNNAGRGIGKRVMELTDSDVNDIFTTNFMSVFYGIQTIIPHFQQRGKGHLINVSSFLGKVPYVPFTSIYGASKSAVNAITGNLRTDLAAGYPDIHVSLVLPGIVKTDFSKNSLSAKAETDIARKDIKERPQTAEELAVIIASLIEKPVNEVYSRPELAERVLEYYRNPAGFEMKPV
jgi:NADP-dependent 3-hydroxy acid dehydrogenase YdfG